MKNHLETMGRSMNRSQNFPLKGADAHINFMGHNEIYPNISSNLSPSKNFLTYGGSNFNGMQDTMNGHNEFDKAGPGPGPDFESECEIHLWDPEQVKQWLVSNHLGDLVGTYLSKAFAICLIFIELELAVSLLWEYEGQQDTSSLRQ